MQATTQAVTEALASSDIVVISGGVSMGDWDFVPGAMTDAGLDIHFTRVAVKPGRPMTFASREGNIVFAMPGNPVSVFVMFHLFLLRAVAAMTGLDDELPTMTLPLGEDYRRKRADRQDHIPARLASSGEIFPVTYHGSAHVQGLLAANGFMVVCPGVKTIAKGEKVAFLPAGALGQ